MRSYLLVFLTVLCLSTSFVHAQPYLEAICKTPVGFHQKGDKIKVVGIKHEEGEVKSYSIQEGNEIFSVKAKRIQLLDEKLDFWTRLWLENRGVDVARNGWKEDFRIYVQEMSDAMLEAVLENNLKYEDAILYDYLYELLYRIQPKSLVKPAKQHLRITLFRSLDAEMHAFSNGMIFISTALLSEMRTEQELIHLLTEAVSQVVLEFDIQYLHRQHTRESWARAVGVLAATATAVTMINDETKYNKRFRPANIVASSVLSGLVSGAIVGSIGRNKTHIDEALLTSVIRRFLNEHRKLSTKRDDEFFKAMANVIGAQAWDSYYNMRFTDAIRLTNKLFDNSATNSSDWVLISKLCRYTNYESFTNENIIQALENEKKSNKSYMYDVDFELAMHHLKQGELSIARELFLTYRENLRQLESEGYDIGKAYSEVNEILERQLNYD